MTLQELLEVVETGKLMKFSMGHGKNGRIIIATNDFNEDEDANKKYVVDASTKNFSRFKEWLGKQARADIQQTGKFYKTKEYGKLPLIQVRLKDEEQDVDTESGETVF